MTRWLDEQEQQAWRSALEAVVVLSRALDAQLQGEAGMPHGYYELLVRLSEAPERSLRMSALAEASGSSRSRLSHAVGQLETRGWVRRETCPQDRRGLVAVLTGAGHEALAAAAPGHVEAVRTLLLDRLTRDQLLALGQMGRAVLDGP